MTEFGSSISENGTRNNIKKLELKLTVRKSTNMVLCAEADNDFVDSLFNFLTIPLGSIEDVLKGNSGLGCIDNLYKSVENLDSKWFNTPPPDMNIHRHEKTLKMILLKPDQMISVGELEALSLLKASLTSTSSALTAGLNHMLKNPRDKDVMSNAKKLLCSG
uniref:Uncharacterized protein n=1 Tax=Solanum lycopersicum TaxID=4081 RepID=K4CRL5_SOLLC